MERYSEPYSATGGLAAEGVINQLGRPDIESLEVAEQVFGRLVRFTAGRLEPEPDLASFHIRRSRLDDAAITSEEPDVDTTGALHVDDQDLAQVADEVGGQGRVVAKGPHGTVLGLERAVSRDRRGWGGHLGAPSGRLRHGRKRPPGH